MDLPFVVLCEGIFEIGAVVEEVQGRGGDEGGGKAGEEDAGSKRKMWVSERISVFARDEDGGGEGERNGVGGDGTES